MSNQDVIAQFFASKGYNYNAILGILGNAKDESGYSPTAYSGNTGTGYGLFQWMPGGRWPVLQSWAHGQGLDPFALNTQLQFAWHEIQTDPQYQDMQPQVLNRAGSPGEAAQRWAESYEGAAQDTYGLRINNANQLAASGYRVPGGTAQPDPPGEIPLSGGNDTAVRNTQADYAQALPDMAGLLTAIPELKGLLDTAIAKDQPTQDFVNAVENSKWYRTHSATVRQQLSQRYSDPATWQANLNQMVGQVHLAAKQLGIPLKAGQDATLANQALMLGWQQADIEHAVASLTNFNKTTSLNGMTGQMAQLTQQLNQLAGQYGQVWQPWQVAYRADNILRGNTTIDTYKQLATTQAKSMFPGLAQQLDQGLTVSDIAQPYQQSMSQILELNPSSIKLTDPLIRQALQGTADAQGVRSSTPIWQFEQRLRNDPRWQYTQNAKDTVATSLVKLGQDFGFGPNG